MAYRRLETTRKTPSALGIQISLACGVLMGIFYPLVAKAITGDHSVATYTVAFLLCVGYCLVCGTGELLPHAEAVDRRPAREHGRLLERACRWHWWGILGGIIWRTGAVLNFAASHAHVIGPATSYAIGQGATMVCAIWGVFIWKEFASTPPNAQKLILLTFVVFLVGLGAVAMAPVSPR